MISALATVLNLLSLLLLTGTIYKDPDTPSRFVLNAYYIYRKIIEISKLQELAQMLLWGARDNKFAYIALNIAWLWFAFGVYEALASLLEMIPKMHWETIYNRPIEVTLSAIILLMVLVVLVVVAISLLFYPLGLSIEWARRGGSNTAFVARLGFLTGVAGILLQLAT